MFCCIIRVVSVPFVDEIMLSHHNTKQMQGNVLLGYRSPIYSHLLELNSGAYKIMQQDYETNFYI